MRTTGLGAVLALLMLFSNSASAVFNGQFLSGPNFHWVVRVLSEKGLCTGSLLNEHWVLTSAHCVRGEMSVQVIDYPENFDFEKFQSLDQLLEEYSGPYQRERAADFLIVEEPVDTVHVHWGSDLALLKTKNPIAGVTQFAALATEEETSLLERLSYVDLVVAGFGMNGKVGRPASEAVFAMLKYYYYTFLEKQTPRFSLPVVPKDIYQTYRGFRPALNDEVPASGESAIAAMGDSGGPLLAHINGQWKIIGVTRNSMGNARWIKFVFGGSMEMPGRVWHQKINQDQLCRLLDQWRVKEPVGGVHCLN